MTPIVCPRCKNNITGQAGVCPHCGGEDSGNKHNIKKIFLPVGSYICRLWHGKYALRTAFWGSFFAVFFTVNILIVLFPNILLKMILPPAAADIVIIMAGYCIYTVYLLICVVGVWRSALNYQGGKLMAASARVFVCGYAVSSLYLTTSGFIFPLLRLFNQL